MRGKPEDVGHKGPREQANARRQDKAPTPATKGTESAPQGPPTTPRNSGGNSENPVTPPPKDKMPETGPLKLRAIPAQSVEAGSLLTVSASVENSAAWEGKLTYSLGTESTAEAAIDASSGIFTWTPPPEYAVSTYVFLIRVESQGGQRDQISFTINVTRLFDQPQPSPPPEVPQQPAPPLPSLAERAVALT